MKLEPSIPDSEFASRVDHVRKKMQKEDISALVVFSSYPEREGHIAYLTNYHGAFPPSQYDRVYRGLGCSALLVSHTSLTLFPGFLFATGKLLGVDKVHSTPNLPLAISKSLTKILKESKVKAVGLAGEDVLPALYLHEIESFVRRKVNRAAFLQSEIVQSLRMIKSDSEQRVIERGASIADAGITAAYESTRLGAKESDLAISAMKACYDEGADYVARTRIYGKGVSGVRWPILTNRSLEDKEITGIDLVGWFNGYGFDVLRRWVVGTPTQAQKDFLGKAATLTEETVKRLKPKMSGDQVSKMTMSVGSEIGFQQEAVSPFGHAIGLEIVENPILLPRSNNKLSAGATVCIEPGIESEELGSVHFEDEAILTESGARVISRITKDFS